MTDEISIREGRAGDRDGVLALRRLAFPESDPDMLTPEFWEWKFRNGYAGPASFFVAQAGEGLVGHLALVPQRYVHDREIPGGLTVDAMTHPAFRSRHVYASLVRAAGGSLAKRFDVFTAYQIRPHVMGGAVASGWVLGDRVPVLVKPLSLAALAGKFISLPAGRTRAVERPQEIRAIEARDLDQVDALVATGAVRQPRTREFLEWRYLRNPRWQYAMDGWFEGHALRAFVVHREVPLRGIRTLAIADCGFDPRGGEAVFRLLLRDLLARARGQRIGLAATFLTKAHPAYRAMRRRGFLRGPNRFNFLLHTTNPSSRQLETAPWSMSWGDTDHL